MDTLSYQFAPGGVTVSPSTPASIPAGPKEIPINIQDVTGTNYDDIIHGDEQAINNPGASPAMTFSTVENGYNVLIGDAGADQLIGTPTSTDMAERSAD